MTSILLADIGGTNSRFAIASSAGRPEQIVIIENNSAASLEMAIEAYLAQTGARPSAAVLADRRADRWRRGGLAHQSELAVSAQRARPALRILDAARVE